MRWIQVVRIYLDDESSVSFAMAQNANAHHLLGQLTDKMFSESSSLSKMDQMNLSGGWLTIGASGELVSRTRLAGPETMLKVLGPTDWLKYTVLSDPVLSAADEQQAKEAAKSASKSASKAPSRVTKDKAKRRASPSSSQARAQPSAKNETSKRSTQETSKRNTQETSKRSTQETSKRSTQVAPDKPKKGKQPPVRHPLHVL